MSPQSAPTAIIRKERTMPQPSHTPGPWTMTKGAHRIEVRINERESYAFALKDEANARLIAAAPPMAEALEAAQAAIAAERDGDAYVHPVHGPMTLEEVKYVLIDPALAKAKGEA